MANVMPEDEDKRLELVFRAAATPVADAGFSQAVMRRVARSVWQRRLVLAAALAAGGAVAFQPLWTIAEALGRNLAVLGGRWPELAWVLHSPYALGAGVLILVVPGLLRWLEE